MNPVRSLKMIMCRDRTTDCHSGQCPQCPGVLPLSELLRELFERTNITEIQYKYWEQKPRCTLVTRNDDIENFIKKFCNDAETLRYHAFIAKEQASYHRFTKENLKDGECIVIVDFAENYAFVIQHAAPGFHWNKIQATLYTVVIYYKMNDILHHKSLVIISDCLNHDSVAVWSYSKVINEFIRTFMTPIKIMYFSDGAPQQFKNYKNFVNIYYHADDFGAPAEWNFFATAHGKGPCDGVGGSVKRLAARTSLQRLYDQQILTPMDLHNWANTPGTLPSINVRYWEQENYEIAENYLASRFEQTKTIPNTLSIHHVTPLENNQLKTKKYSTANEYLCHKIKKEKKKKVTRRSDENIDFKKLLYIS